MSVKDRRVRERCDTTLFWIYIDQSNFAYRWVKLCEHYILILLTLSVKSHNHIPKNVSEKKIYIDNLQSAFNIISRVKFGYEWCVSPKNPRSEIVQGSIFFSPLTSRNGLSFYSFSFLLNGNPAPPCGCHHLYMLFSTKILATLTTRMFLLGQKKRPKWVPENTRIPCTLFKKSYKLELIQFGNFHNKLHQPLTNITSMPRIACFYTRQFSFLL